jgi:hypothetical protein
MARLAAAIIVALLNLLILAAVSFVCGGLLEIFDAIGRSKPVELWRAGLFAAMFGVLLFGAPIALIAAVHTWNSGTHLHEVLRKPRLQVGLEMLFVASALTALIMGIWAVAT